MPELTERPLITTDQEFRRFVDTIRAAGRFAFDTEFVSEETFEPVLCLIQVATERELAAIDPLAVRDVSGFWDAVKDPAIDVVMHASGEDLRICRMQTGGLPERVFDVQLAAGLCGSGYPLSLGNLVQQTLGASVFGGETRTDWRRRPLSASQLRYALDDVRHLLPMADILSRRLKELERESWADSEFRDYVSAISGRDDESRWRKLSGLHHLSRRSLEVARRLSRWRIDEARRVNRPIRQILRDDLLVAIAKRQPASRHDLEALRDFNRPHLLSKAQEILGVIADAQAVDAAELPEPNERHDDAPGITMLVNVLAAALATCCADSHVAMGLIGSASDLKELVRWQSLGCPEQDRPALAQGWRGQVCGDTLIDVLSGRSTLRVTDPSSDIPIAVQPRAIG